MAAANLKRCGIAGLAALDDRWREAAVPRWDANVPVEMPALPLRRVGPGLDGFPLTSHRGRERLRFLIAPEAKTEGARLRELMVSAPALDGT